MATDLKKRMNVVLASGLCVVSAKLRKDAPLVTLFITDYTDNTRVLLDLEHKRVISNRDDVAFTAKDIDAIAVALGVVKEEKKAV